MELVFGIIMITLLVDIKNTVENIEEKLDRK